MFGKDYKRVGSHQTILLVCNGTTLGVFIIQERVGVSITGRGLVWCVWGWSLVRGLICAGGEYLPRQEHGFWAEVEVSAKLEILFWGIHSIARFIRNIYRDYSFWEVRRTPAFQNALR